MSFFNKNRKTGAKMNIPRHESGQGSDVDSVSTLLRIRRVQRHTGQYYIQVLLPDTEKPSWQTVSRGYVHKTSADAALGRGVAREMLGAVPTTQTRKVSNGDIS